MRIGRMTKAEMQGVSVFKLTYVYAHAIRIYTENHKQKSRWAKGNLEKVTESKQKEVNSTEGDWRRQRSTEKERGVKKKQERKELL